MAKRKQAIKDLGKSFKKGLKANVKMVGNALDFISDATQKDVIGMGKNIKEGFKNSKASAQANKGIFKNIKDILFNHPEWYENYPLNGLVNLNFGRRKGILELYSGLAQSQSPAENQTGQLGSIPSVASIETLLYRPYTDTNDFEQAINYMYSTIRSANSGSVNYKAVDLADYILDVRQMHAIYADMRRTYACLNDIRITDSKTPAVYLAALGKDYNSFSDNNANLRAYANKLSVQISKLLPLDLDILNRTRWMFTNFFLDSNDAKASPFCFRLGTISSVHGSNVDVSRVSVNGTSTGISYNEYITNVKALMQEIVNDERYIIIAGDILKTFGESAIYPSEIWAENMQAPFIYDEAALTQIQNATLRFGGSSGKYTRTYGLTRVPDVEGVPFSGWPIYRLIDAVNTTDNAGMTQYLRTMISNYDNKATEKLSSIYNIEAGFVNSYKDNISAGETLSYTRLKHDNIYRISDDSVGIEVHHAGTEVVTNVTVFRATQYYSAGLEPVANTQYLSLDYGNIGYFVNLSGAAGLFTPSLVTAMDWFPLITPFTVYGNDDYYTMTPMWDFNNYARLGEGNLNSFHGYAIMSLLATDRVVRQSATHVISDTKGVTGN